MGEWIQKINVKNYANKTLRSFFMLQNKTTKNMLQNCKTKITKMQKSTKNSFPRSKKSDSKKLEKPILNLLI